MARDGANAGEQVEYRLNDEREAAAAVTRFECRVLCPPLSPENARVSALPGVFGKCSEVPRRNKTESGIKEVNLVSTLRFSVNTIEKGNYEATQVVHALGIIVRRIASSNYAGQV